MYKNTKLFSVLSYFTWIGFVIALLMREKDDRMVLHHLNQSLVIHIIESIGGILIRRHGLIGVAGEIIDIACFVLWIMGLVRAARLSDEPLPYIGDIHLLN